MRPWVVRVARALGLTGWVQNCGSHVALNVQGPRAKLARFALELRGIPAPADVSRMRWRRLSPVQNEACFELRQSVESPGARLPLPPDLRTCPACLKEMEDPTARRYGYPLLACAQCGPRFTLVRRVPYDRARTSMADFTMCEDCAREYGDVADRRFHAVPMACARCGPRVRLLDRHGAQLAGEADTVHRAAKMLREGRVVAVKGVGGFQLLCDGLDPAAVRRLRDRKHRPHQPFALLVPDLAMVRQFAHCDALESQQLRSSAGPIVLLRPREDGQVRPAAGVAPDVPRVGVMLPTSGLHAQLARAVGRPLVCTSGNVHDEPIELSIEGALERLAGVAEAFVDHDRPIVRRADDSVVQVLGDRVQVLRCARGLSPLRLELEHAGPTRWCAGAHTKNAPALVHEGEVVLWPHVGDLESPRAREAFATALDSLGQLLGVCPRLAVCDAHPDYASTLWFERGEFAVQRVHHHAAHVAAVLAEHGVDRGLGFAFDGIGLGPDATAWGGEALLLGPRGGARRVAHLHPFALPGAGRAAREPRRALAGMQHACGLDAAAPFGPLLASGRAPSTSAAGRLLEGFAALVGLDAVASYEGQTAAAFERLGAPGADPYPFSCGDGVLDWRPAFREALAQRTEPRLVASRVHATLAAMVEHIAVRDRSPCVVLSGGCFQNQVLVAETLRRLDARGIQAFLPRRVPPGDGGLALGQAWLSRTWSPAVAC